MLFLIVGLGNPGKSYRESRHNIGFMVVDFLAERYGIEWGRKRFSSETGSGSIDDQRVLLLKPQTYMNLSGESVSAASRFYKIPVERIVVAHDDIDLPLGRIQVRRGGGHAGHKGVESVASHLGSAGFTRIRTGVGRPLQDREVSDFVLEGFAAGEGKARDDVVERASKAIVCVMQEGLTAAMNQYNPWGGRKAEGEAGEREETRD